MFKRFRNWITGTESQGLGSVLQGIGTMLIGIGAIGAFYKTDEVLDKLLEIKHLSEMANQRIAQFESEFKAAAVNQAIEYSPALRSAKPSRASLEKAISFIPSQENLAQSGVILPKERREETVNSLLQTDDVNLRRKILLNSLEYINDGNMKESNNAQANGSNGTAIGKIGTINDSKQ